MHTSTAARPDSRYSIRCESLDASMHRFFTCWDARTDKRVEDKEHDSGGGRRRQYAVETHTRRSGHAELLKQKSPSDRACNPNHHIDEQAFASLVGELADKEASNEPQCNPDDY